VKNAITLRGEERREGGRGESWSRWLGVVSLGGGWVGMYWHVG
jgi:hypothetical protein